MIERPILFSAPMVRALLDGTKTQTRRALRHQVTGSAIMQMGGARHAEIINEHGVHIPGWNCPYGQPGDRLWVRETWAPHPDFPGTTGRAVYRADLECKYDVDRWRPSIHMPRWASRILLEIVSVRVERLNAIDEADARAEGVMTEGRHKGGYCAGEFLPPSIRAYRDLWESINGSGSWADNPWVWVVDFKRVTP